MPVDIETATAPRKKSVDEKTLEKLEDIAVGKKEDAEKAVEEKRSEKKEKPVEEVNKPKGKNVDKKENTKETETMPKKDLKKELEEMEKKILGNQAQETKVEKQANAEKKAKEEPMVDFNDPEVMRKMVEDARQFAWCRGRPAGATRRRSAGPVSRSEHRSQEQQRSEALREEMRALKAGLQREVGERPARLLHHLRRVLDATEERTACHERELHKANEEEPERQKEVVQDARRGAECEQRARRRADLAPRAADAATSGTGAVGRLCGARERGAQGSVDARLRARGGRAALRGHPRRRAVRAWGGGGPGWGWGGEGGEERRAGKRRVRRGERGARAVAPGPRAAAAPDVPLVA